MGANTSKIDIVIAEQGIRNRIDNIMNINTNKHFLYNLVNDTINYTDEMGETLLVKRLIHPSDLVVVSRCMYSMLLSIDQKDRLEVSKRFLHSILDQYTSKNNFSDI